MFSQHPSSAPSFLSVGANEVEAWNDQEILEVCAVSSVPVSSVIIFRHSMLQSEAIGIKVSRERGMAREIIVVWLIIICREEKRAKHKQERGSETSHPLLTPHVTIS